MRAEIKNHIIRTQVIDWRPLLEEGIDTDGIYIKTLRVDKNGRSPSFLLAFDKGASYPYHNHPTRRRIVRVGWHLHH